MLYEILNSRENMSCVKTVQKYDEINQQIHTNLIDTKNMIEQFTSSCVWDRVKKCSNDYETISSNMPNKSPVSRSYFKMVEIWNVLQSKGLQPQSKIVSAHMCEAPGGFIEALIDIARCKEISIERSIGMSLKNEDRKVPIWKISKALMQKHNIQVHYGEDGTGDVYNIHNVDSFIRRNENKCNIITADGGFDFSDDYNNQEFSFQKLFACEAYMGICSQCIGGSFILKIFDTLSLCTIKMLYVLSTFYSNMFVLKPCSSRPANSERYIICSGFYGVDNNEYLPLMRRNAESFSESHYSDINVPLWFMHTITEVNVNICTNQMLNIYKTFAYINVMNKGDITDDLQLMIKKKQKNAGEEWFINNTL